MTSAIRRLRLRPVRPALDESGFTLIELMVVVLIIAILISMAIPTFAGVKKKANDRAAQTRIRNVFTAERIYFTESQQYVDDATGIITSIEPQFSYGGGMIPGFGKDAYLGVASNILYVSAKSKSGRCFYLRDDAVTGTAYALDVTCAAADSQTYFVDGW